MVLTEAERWWRPYRQVADVRVLHVDLSPHDGWEERALRWLDVSERQRRDRFFHDGPRYRFTLCRAALRSILCDELACGNEDLAFEVSAHGKPSATVQGAAASVGFNVSHSGRHGLIALSPRGRVGVDVEERTRHRNLDDLIAGVLGPAEQAEVDAARGEAKLRLFFTLWTLKEALGKAHGMGLSLDVARFEIPPAMRRGEQSGVVTIPDSPGVAWRLENLGHESFAAALAHELNPVAA